MSRETIDRQADSDRDKGRNSGSIGKQRKQTGLNIARHSSGTGHGQSQLTTTYSLFRHDSLVCCYTWSHCTSKEEFVSVRLPVRYFALASVSPSLSVSLSLFLCLSVCVSLSLTFSHALHVPNKKHTRNQESTCAHAH